MPIAIDRDTRATLHMVGQSIQPKGSQSVAVTDFLRDSEVSVAILLRSMNGGVVADLKIYKEDDSPVVIGMDDTSLPPPRSNFTAPAGEVREDRIAEAMAITIKNNYPDSVLYVNVGNPSREEPVLFEFRIMNRGTPIGNLNFRLNHEAALQLFGNGS